MSSARGLGVACVVAVIATACVLIESSGGREDDRSAVLRDSADLVIVPGQRAFAERATELREAIDAYCAAPDELRLAAARTAFIEALLRWETTLAWGFGPIVDQRLEGEIDFWPSRPATIDTNIASGEPFTDAWVDSLGVAGKGLPALELLLFGDEATLTDASRCAYAVALGAHVERSAQRLLTAWNPEHRDAFATAGRGSAVYRAQLDALSTMLTQMISALQRIKLAKLGGPLGRGTSGVPQPDAVELPYAHASVAAMIATLEGLRALWLVEGGDGSLDRWVRERDVPLADRVIAEIDGTIAALRAIPEPLSEYVAGGDLSAGDAAHDAVRALERTLASDVSSVIAISVMFTDSDGD